MKLVQHVTSLDRPTWEMIWKKCSLHLIFTFYLNRDTSVVEFPLSMCLKKKGDSLYEVMEVRADTITYNWNRL